MYRTIVVGTDGSPSATSAVEAAISLAKTCKARLHVVSVVRPQVAASAIAASTGIDPGFAELERLGREQAGEVLAKEKANAEAAGLEVETHSVTGNPSEAILDVADSHDADLIVVGNRGMKGARRILGSVPNNIAHHASCAVLIVPTS